MRHRLAPGRCPFPPRLRIIARKAGQCRRKGLIYERLNVVSIVSWISESVANVAGFIGMASVVSAYCYSTVAKKVNPVIQHSVNLFGAAMLTISLLVFTNPASLVLEAVWSTIAIIGLWKSRKA